MPSRYDPRCVHTPRPGSAETLDETYERPVHQSVSDALGKAERRSQADKGRIRIGTMGLSRGDDTPLQTYLTSLDSFIEHVNNQCFILWSPSHFRKVPIDSGEEVIHIISPFVWPRHEGTKKKWEEKNCLVRLGPTRNAVYARELWGYGWLQTQLLVAGN